MPVAGIVMSSDLRTEEPAVAEAVKICGLEGSGGEKLGGGNRPRIHDQIGGADGIGIGRFVEMEFDENLVAGELERRGSDRHGEGVVAELGGKRFERGVVQFSGKGAGGERETLR